MIAVTIHPRPKEVYWGEAIGYIRKVNVKGVPDVWKGHDYIDFNGSKDKGVSIDLYLDQCPIELFHYRFQQYLIGDEGYLIRVHNKGAHPIVWIKANSSRGYYYAYLTWVQMVKYPLFEGWVLDWPLLPIRGIVEGYYGKPWSSVERIRSFDILARQKMNTYIYAPKNDRYHRDLWKVPYPSDVLQDLAGIILEAERHHLDFVFGVSPGLTIRYHAMEDYNHLLGKFVQLYRRGVRSFGLFFDDIPMSLYHSEDKATFGDLVSAQCHVILSLYAGLKDLDPTNRLMVCPTLYSGEGNEDYIMKLGRQLPKDITILWTGRKICSPEITAREARVFYENTEHLPLYWDNYPVNDANMRDEMHIGPYLNRDPKLYLFANGIIANVMEFAESSLIPLMTIGSYSWNPEKYDPEESFTNAINEVVGIKDADAFKWLCDCVNQSVIDPLPGSKLMAKWFSCQQSWEQEETKIQFIAFLSDVKHQVESLFQMQNTKLATELRKWIEEAVKDLESLLSFFDKSKFTSHDKLAEWVYDRYKGRVRALGFFPYLIMNEILTMADRKKK